MGPISTTADGLCIAFPDVCNVPGPTGPIPTPFPNMAQCKDANGATTTQKVKIGGCAVLTVNTQIVMSSGDEPGVAGGLISGTFIGPMRYSAGDSSVLFEGGDAVTVLAQTAHNGTNANAPLGTQVTPSQTTVVIGS